MNRTHPLRRDPIVAEIYRLRVERGWNQTELARRAGVSTSFVSALEAGRRGCTLYTLRLVAAALDLDVCLRPRGAVGRG